MIATVMIPDEMEDLFSNASDAANSNGDNLKHLSVIANAIRKSKRCVVITGAGISVSGGIPVSVLHQNLLFNT